LVSRKQPILGQAAGFNATTARFFSLAKVNEKGQINYQA
jgi:hypothetical protein